MKAAVMALSGGMDSSSLLLRLLREGYDVTALSFDYGQKHVVELERASQLIDYLGQHGHKVQHHVADLRSATALFQSHLLSGGEEVPRGHYEEENMKATVVPNRNAMFASSCSEWNEGQPQPESNFMVDRNNSVEQHTHR